MYRINPLMRNVLITTDEVIFHAPTKHTLDPRTIQNSIIIAEERFIRPALSSAYYEYLCGIKNKEVTADNKSAIEAEITNSLPAGSDPVVLEVGDIVNSRNYLTGHDLNLWKQHLWKLIAEAVVLVSFPEGFVQFTSEGVVHNAPPAGPMTTSGVVSPDLKTVKWSLDKKIQLRIDPLLEAMHNWICERKIYYPVYGKPCDCDASGKSIGKRSDWVLGIYDDEENDCCR